MKARSIAIIGAGGHGRACGSVAGIIGYDQVHFFDDWYETLAFGEKSGLALKGSFKDYLAMSAGFDAVHVGIGNNRIRQTYIHKLMHLNIEPASLIHPGSLVSQTAHVGAGSIVFPGTVVGLDVEVGIGCILNTNSTIEHDSRVEDFAHIAPGAVLCGSCVVGNQAFVGASAVLRQGVSVGAGSIVGMGAAVTRDVPEGKTVAGVPAVEI